MTGARPELDPELKVALEGLPASGPLSLEALPEFRLYAGGSLEPQLKDREVERVDTTTTSVDGVEVPLTVLSPPKPVGAPCIYWMHGGGMVMGDRFSQIDIPLEWLDEFGAVVVTVEYRLAPEASGATLVEDCYSGLLWVVEHADELGVDPARIVVAGTSAGGGLAAGVCLMARDRGGPVPFAQMLIYPMLDHRNDSASSLQYTEPGIWTHEKNAFGWEAVLGELGDVPSYVSPALADDLSGLPTLYVDAGSAEVFRDEDVRYAERVWASGGQAELHVWAGGFHGFDALFPDVRVSKAARETRKNWLRRVLAA